MGLRPAAATLFAALALAVFASAVSGASSTTTTSPPNTAITVAKGGTVTVAVSSLPTEFNPSTVAGSNAITEMVMAQVWPQAFIVGSNDLPRTGPGLVTSAELVSVNPQTVVYTLAKRARWSDGVPITASDFIYDWHEYVAVGPSLPAFFPLAGYQAIKSVTGSKGGHVVTVVFKTSYADWNALFSDLVPAHIAARYGWARAFSGSTPKHMVSGGPFAIARVSPGKELVLTRNPHYWGTPAQLDRIVFRVEPSTSATLRALANGSVDVAQLYPSTNVTSAVLRSHDLVETESESPELWQLVFNLADPTLSSLAVRQAVADSIDRAQLLANSVGIVSPSLGVAGNRIFADGAPGHRDNDTSQLKVNASAADLLLESAGVSFDQRGEASVGGKPLVLTVSGPSGSPMVAALESQLAADLLESGIVLRVDNVDPTTFLSAMLPEGRYQLALVPYLLSRYPSTSSLLYTNPVGPTPDALTDVATTTIPVSSTVATHVGGSEDEPGAAAAGVVTRDVLGLDDPAIATLYAQAASQLNFETDASLYNQIDTDLWAVMPSLPLFQQPVALVRSDKIVNILESPTWVGPLWDAQNWAIQISPPPTTSTSVAPG